MARPSSMSTTRSRPVTVKKKVQSSSDEDDETSSDGLSDGQARNNNSDDSEEDGPIVSVQANGKGNQRARRTAAVGKKRAVMDSSDDDDAAVATGQDGNDDEEDSQNRRVGINNNTRTAKSSSEGSSKGSKSSTSTSTTKSGALMQPLQPRAQHSQAQQPHPAAASRSPFRTVSLNDASPGGGSTAGGGPAAAHKRRLSNTRIARADDLRRQSLPSNLRKQAPLDSDASFVSAASSSQDSPVAAARRGSNSYGNNSITNMANTPTRHASGSSIAQAQMRRTSAGYALQGGGVGALNAAAALHRTASSTSGGATMNDMAAPPQLPTLTMEVMNTNYEEWMKMATDNKINSSNTWSFALIDYFHDMSLLRNADDEGSINFQKASCTLDGCVKIWTSRVDSVATETGKLLNGLAGDAAARAEEEDDDDEEGEGDGVDENGERRPKKKKTKTHTATLAENFDKIKVKELDLEFTVDPLFKKTSADFDEGGAAGLLMNHLGSDSTMRVVFDAGDAKVDDGDEEEAEPEDDGLEEDEKLPLVDISKLKETCLPDPSVLKEMTICPSFSSFKFSSDPSILDMGLFNRSRLDASTSGTNDDGASIRSTPGVALDDLTVMPGGEGGAPQDFFDDADGGYNGNDDGGYDDGDGAGGFEAAYGGPDDGGSDAEGAAYGAAEYGQDPQYGAVQRFDPRAAPDDREVVIGIGGEEGDKKVFNYFDTALAKNWAGPEHWKMRRTVRRYEKEKEQEEAAANKATRGKKVKEAFSLNFTTSDDNVAPSAKTIFATSKASLTVSSTNSSKRKKGTLANKKEDYLLPDDKHFSSQQLLTLFLKPKAAISMRRRLQRLALRPEGEVDERYWAAAAAAQAVAGDDAGGDDDDDYGPALPFDTQFFHDDGDTPDFDDDLPMGGDEFEGMASGPSGDNADAAGTDGSKVGAEEEDDLLKATQGQMKRARPQFVTYAKKAKRVDVKKLKENIWRELALEMAPTAQRQEDPVREPIKEFTSVISGLRTVYPEDKMEEISTSFCFICLLHLANEQGLRIQEGDVSDQPSRGTRAERASSSRQTTEQEEENDDSISKKLRSVGGLEKLRIKREIIV